MQSKLQVTVRLTYDRTLQMEGGLLTSSRRAELRYNETISYFRLISKLTVSSAQV